MSNLTITASGLSDSESLTASCPTPPSSAISEHSLIRDLPSFIEGLRTSLPEDSLVNRFPSPASEPEPMIPETCGPQLSNAFASYDRNTRSWRMFQGWLLADILGPSWETWPKAGSIVDGVFYPQPNWERRISEIGSGLLPTPVVPNGGRQHNLDNITMRGKTLYRRDGTKAQMDLQTYVRMWPTPRSRESGDYQYSRGDKSKKVLTLTGAVKMWPTPAQRDWRSGKGRQENGHSPQLPEVVGGKLNPTFVEWLMAWPLEWTDLGPLEMDKFLLWLQQHGGY